MRKYLSIILITLLIPTLCMAALVRPIVSDIVQPVVSDLFGTSGSSVTAYGMIWDATADTYQIGTVTSGVFTEEAVESFPIQEEMKRCTLLDNGTVNYYLDPTDSTLKADGVTASVLDGTDGQVMVEIPQFYALQCQYGNYRYFFISDGEFTLTLPDESVETATIHPAFYKGGAATASDYRYVGAYEAAMWDATTSAIVPAATVHTNMYAAGDKMCSVSGYYPKPTETIVEYRDMAEARGAGWHQFDHALHAAISILYLTEYADFNTQAQIGNGRVSLSGGDWVASEIFDGTNYGYIGKCGLSDSVGNATGANNEATNLTLAESPAYMSYRGIENWWGNIYKFMDGINFYNSTAGRSQLYLATDHSEYASDTTTGYSLSGNLAEADGYPVDIIDTVGVYPSAVGGSNATYLADYYYTSFDNDNDSGWRVAHVGGNANNGAYAGAFCVYSYYGSTTAIANIGGRLCY